MNRLEFITATAIILLRGLCPGLVHLLASAPLHPHGGRRHGRDGPSGPVAARGRGNARSGDHLHGTARGGTDRTRSPRPKPNCAPRWKACAMPATRPRKCAPISSGCTRPKRQGCLQPPRRVPRLPPRYLPREGRSEPAETSSRCCAGRPDRRSRRNGACPARHVQGQAQSSDRVRACHRKAGRSCPPTQTVHRAAVAPRAAAPGFRPAPRPHPAAASSFICGLHQRRQIGQRRDRHDPHQPRGDRPAAGHRAAHPRRSDARPPNGPSPPPAPPPCRRSRASAASRSRASSRRSAPAGASV